MTVPLGKRGAKSYQENGDQGPQIGRRRGGGGGLEASEEGLQKTKGGTQ
jgi:hypothetical protein